MFGNLFHINKISPLALALLCIVFVQCSTKKDAALNRAYHNMTAHYNAYFNGIESYKSGEEKLLSSEKDDYSEVLSIFKYGDENSSKSVYPEMDLAILKASKVIQRHKITDTGKKRKKKKKKKKRKKRKRKKKKKKKKKEEKEDLPKNWIDDSYLLIGKSQFIKRDYKEAMESFEYVARHYKKYPIKFQALMWMAKTHMSEEKFGEAKGIWNIIDDKDNVDEFKALDDKTHVKIALSRCDFYIQQKMYGPAIKPLKEAIKKTKKKPKKARLTYILAQLYQKQRDFETASKYFDQVLYLSPSYEMAFNAQINKAKGQSGNTKETIRALKKMLTDENNSDYFDQIYYALADLALAESDEEAVIDYLKQSIQATISNNKQKGKSYVRLADIYFNKPNFPIAAAYYDSASTTLNNTYEGYDDILTKKNSLKDIVKYLNTISFEDSVQALATLNPKDRFKIIDNLIAEAIEKKRKENAEENSTYSPDPLKSAMTSSKGGSQWYFYNTSALSFGFTDFQKKWGERKLEDNWRRKDKSSFEAISNEEVFDQESETEEEMLLEEELTDRNSYLKRIPLSEDKMSASHDRIIEAYYNLGIIYKELLLDIPESIKAFEALLNRYPENKYRLFTCYQLYRLLLGQGNKTKANVYKNIILTDYPDSDYAKIIQNPGYIKQLEAKKNKEKKYYEETYRTYLNNQFTVVIKRCENADSLFLENKLQPKFDFLKALSIGKSKELIDFEKALKEVIKDHPADTVKVEAEKLLAMISNHNNLQTSEDNETKKKRNSYNFDKKMSNYYIMIVPDSTVKINQLKTDVSNFNRKFFSLIKLTTDHIILDKTYQLIVVKSFNNLDKGIDYLNTIKNNKKTLQSIKSENILHLLISTENFPTFYKEKDIEEYNSFFKSNYPN